MARKPKIIRPVNWVISFPEDLAAKISLELYSEVEGKIPFAARQKFFISLAEDYFRKKDAAVEKPHG